MDQSERLRLLTSEEVKEILDRFNVDNSENLSMALTAVLKEVFLEDKDELIKKRIGL